MQHINLVLINLGVNPVYDKMESQRALRRLAMLQCHLDHINDDCTSAEPNEVLARLFTTSTAITLIGSMILDVQVNLLSPGKFSLIISSFLAC